MHELPRRDSSLVIFDVDPARAKAAAERITAGDRRISEVVFGETWLQQGPTRSGPSSVRLWSPHSIVSEAVEHARRSWGDVTGRRALDIACGTGRDAIYLGLCGFDVEGWDILPDALERCDDLARRNGVTVRTRCRDVEEEGVIIEPQGYDLIACVNFLHRSLMSQIVAGVRRGGLVVYETFVEPQRERFGKPGREIHVLKPGELPQWFTGWELLACREGLSGPRRFAAGLIARRQ
jgi:SAM-dependent methyltransferase